MREITVIGLDLAKSVLQVHGERAPGEVVVSRRLSRSQVEAYFAKLPACVVAMEACASAHHWGRVISGHGHEVRLLPAREVKPFVRLPKTDASDAAAICEAARRPRLRTVPVKTVEAQAMCTAHAVRDRLIGIRTQQINMLRGHLAEYGIVAATGREGAVRLKGIVRQGLGKPGGEALPKLLSGSMLALVEAIDATELAIEAIDKDIRRAAAQDEKSRRLGKVDGLGVLSSTALVAFAGDVTRFKGARAFVAWLGLAPKVEASGGKTRVGRISKAGNAYVRRLLIHGARSLIHWSRQGKAGGKSAWIEALLARRPKAVVIVAVAAKLARIAWAMLARGQSYRRPGQAEAAA